MPTQKLFNQFLIFVNLYQHAKKSVYSISTFFRYSQILSTATILATPTFGHAHPEIFNHLLIWVGLCQHTKKSITFICSFLRHS